MNDIVLGATCALGIVSLMVVYTMMKGTRSTRH